MHGKNDEKGRVFFFFFFPQTVFYRKNYTVKWEYWVP